MKTNTVAKDGRAGPWARFFGMASVAILARFASTEVHESLHFLVGRLAGLPGVTPYDYYERETVYGAFCPVIPRFLLTLPAMGESRIPSRARAAVISGNAFSIFPLG
jgi:hypothetical protein